MAFSIGLPSDVESMMRGEISPGLGAGLPDPMTPNVAMPPLEEDVGGGGVFKRIFGGVNRALDDMVLEATGKGKQSSGPVGKAALIASLLAMAKGDSQPLAIMLSGKVGSENRDYRDRLEKQKETELAIKQMNAETKRTRVEGRLGARKLLYHDKKTGKMVFENKNPGPDEQNFIVEYATPGAISTVVSSDGKQILRIQHADPTRGIEYSETPIGWTKTGQLDQDKWDFTREQLKAKFSMRQAAKLDRYNLAVAQMKIGIAKYNISLEQMTPKQETDWSEAENTWKITQDLIKQIESSADLRSDLGRWGAVYDKVNVAVFGEGARSEKTREFLTLLNLLMDNIRREATGAAINQGEEVFYLNLVGEQSIPAETLIDKLGVHAKAAKDRQDAIAKAVSKRGSGLDPDEFVPKMTDVSGPQGTGARSSSEVPLNEDGSVDFLALSEAPNAEALIDKLTPEQQDAWIAWAKQKAHEAELKRLTEDPIESENAE